MPASSRSLQRGLALLLGLLLGLASAFLPTSLSAATAPAAALPKTPGSPSLRASSGLDPITTLDQTARAAFAAGKGDEAARLWRQAAEAARGGGDTLLQARLLSNLALAQLLRGEPAEAERSLEAGFALLDASAQPADSPLQQRSRAQLLHARARVQFERGQLQAALSSWRQVEPLYRELGARDAEWASLVNQAEVLHSLGHLTEARTLLESLLQRTDLSEQPQLKSSALASLAVILKRQGETEDAQALVPKLTVLAADRASDPLARQKASLALAYLSSSRDPSPSPQQIADTLGNGSLQAKASLLAERIEKEEFTAVSKLWPQLLEEVSKLPGNAASLELRLNLAKSLRLLRERESSDTASPVPSESQLRQLLQRSLADAERLGDPRASSLATGELGALARSAGRLKEAETLSQQALRQSMALNLPELSSRWLWELASIFRKEGNRAAALVAYQQALDELSTLRLDLASSSPAVASSFTKSLEPISREFIDLLTAPPAATDTDRDRARKVMEELQVAELNDFFRLACFKTGPIASGNERNVAVVYPMLLPDRLEVIVRLPGEKDKILHRSQPLDTETLGGTVNILQRQLQTQPMFSDSTSELLRLAQQLHQWLFGDPKEKNNLEQQLKDFGITQLVFVPDVALRNLPMAVLHDGKSFLGERYAITVAPGMLLTPSTRRPGSQPRVFGAGVSTKIAQVEGLPQGSMVFPPLPAVERELQELRNRTGATKLLNETFTKQALQKALESGDYSVVHLATHGQFSSNPSSTFLITGRGELIRVKQLADFLQPSQRRTGNSLDLLILSACESASNDDNANLGLAAVAARSGASSTIASLWSVNDEATALLMDSFYQHWLRDRSDGRPISKAKALSLAQSDVRNATKTSHPYYWAAFTLLGDWR